MRILLAVVAVLGLMSSRGFGQAEAIIKQRAKELSNQNNVRQGVPPPTPAKPPPAAPRAAPAAPPAAAPAALNPAAAQQQSVARIRAGIAALATNSPTAPEQKLQFVRVLMAAARGVTKPSQTSVTKFANGLTVALADKTLSPADQLRLAQDIEAILNSTKLPQSQTDAIVADVQAILQNSDVKRAVAVAVADDLKAVAAEVQKRN